jgi:phosphatidylinositol kinase/protein kinase (PI-3  family)
LRVNSDIILAMLEAFLYDPLLSWTVSVFSSVFGETDE